MKPSGTAGGVRPTVPGPPQPGFWSLKPWWCQPWSLLLTGTAGVAGSWWLLHSSWLTAVAALLVALWWLLFLVLAPAAHYAALAPPPESSAPAPQR